ncbi:ABC transporter ATP-binding protein/permease [bacterium]|nr:ABC transporter ATP-binding protein/permease [bacterium]
MALTDLHRARKYINRRRLHVVSSHLCSLLAGILYVGWMVLLVFCIDLLEHKGIANFVDADARYAHEIAPLRPSENGSLDIYQQNGTGLLPTLVRLRNKWFGPALEQFYNEVSFTHSDVRFLILIAITAITIGVVRFLLLLLQSRLLVAATASAQARLQTEIFDKQFELGGNAVTPTNQSKVESILRDDLPTVLQSVQRYMERIVREPAKMISLLAFSFLINVPLSLSFVILSVLAWITGERLWQSFHRHRESLEETSRKATSQLLGLATKHRVIAGFSAENHYTKSFGAYVERAKQATEQRLTYEGRLTNLGQFAGLIIFIVILVLAAQNVLKGKFELSAACGLFGSLLSLTLPVFHMVDLRRTMQNGSASAARLFQFLDTPTPTKQKGATANLPRLTDAIDFEHVSYEDMDGNMVLSDVSIRIHRGQRIAVMAKTEPERRAFIYLINRFIEPTAGKIKIDGTEIKKVSPLSLRSQLAVVLESDVLLPDTVAGNIGCGDVKFSATQITEAAKLAHAHHFIQKLPNGYECVIGPEGFPIKPGEAYRIALARAILRDPAIVCLEEPKDRLDPDTKSLLDDTMERFCHNRTVIVLPSRLTTLRACDQIFLLQDGKLAAVGSHRELVETNDLYRHLQYVEFHSPQFTK